jgi:DNA-binding transcriptional regulator PaaX
MSKKYGTFSSDLLTAIGEATGFFSWPLPYSRAYAWKQMKRNKDVYDTIYSLKQQGLIKERLKNGKKFISLTSDGQLELLLRKAVMEKPLKWDGRWRIIVFDIPEDSRDKRDALRFLLKKNSYIKLQASVFISPYPLNREAVDYLKQSKLIGYIRIIRADEIDDDKDLRKKFNL